MPVPVQRQADKWVVEEAAKVLPVGASADVLVVGGASRGCPRHWRPRSWVRMCSSSSAAIASVVPPPPA
jgi:hypothetical protein